MFSTTDAIIYTSKLFDIQIDLVVSYCPQNVLYEFALNLSSLCLMDDDLYQHDSPCLANGFNTIRVHRNPELFCTYKIDNKQKRVYLPFIGLKQDLGSIDYDNVEYQANDTVFGKINLQEVRVR